MRIHDVTCGMDEVTGQVTNRSSKRLDIYLRVFEIDSRGSQLDDRLAAVTGLAPGETGRWTSLVLVDGYTVCEIVLDEVFES